MNEFSRLSRKLIFLVICVLTKRTKKRIIALYVAAQSDKLVHTEIEDRRAERTSEIYVSLGVIYRVEDAEHHQHVGIFKVSLAIRKRVEKSCALKLCGDRRDHRLSAEEDRDVTRCDRRAVCLLLLAHKSEYFVCNVSRIPKLSRIRVGLYLFVILRILGGSDKRDLDLRRDILLARQKL